MGDQFPGESELCTIVADLLQDQPIGVLDLGREEVQSLLHDLENFLPALLREADPHWRYDGFDDVAPKSIKKLGERTLVFRGWGLQFSIYREVPLTLFIELAHDKRRIAECECLGGEPVDQGGRPFHVAYDIRDDPTVP